MSAFELQAHVAQKKTKKQKTPGSSHILSPLQHNCNRDVTDMIIFF